MADVMRDPRVLLAACLLHPLPVALATAIKEVLATAPQQQAEPDHETRAELAEQQVVQLTEERDHYRRLWQKAQQAEPVAWMESPYGAIRANPAYKIKFPSKLLHWQIPLFITPQQQAEPVQRKPLTDAEIEIIHSAVGNS